MRKRKWLMLVAVVVATTVMAVVGASVYMLDYSLAPDPNRRDVDSGSGWTACEASMPCATRSW